MNYIELGRILQEARNALGLKQIDVANKLGCTSANISSWERGKSKIDIDSFAELCDIYNLDFAKTLESISNGNQEALLDKLSAEEKEHIKKYRSLDLYGKKTVDSVLNIQYERCNYIEGESNVIELSEALLRASAGTGNLLEDEILRTVKVIASPEARKADIIIEIDGNSMNPIYQDGDKVLVRLQPAVEIGEIGIFIMDGNGYIKEFAKDRLISVNPEYDDIYPSEYSDFRCVGKVLGKAEVVD